ncbi:hypothetical protein OPT61_g9367 [Boeremia exigua]|uniref:Uncharacterized protein n=1 Tax=Boeremia exigua TaxID=749465 RepID=A0ACC2HUF1_9PLEO|nr:hypothetical protein OPT61_g9367 [Boeremia exigua]
MTARQCNQSKEPVVIKSVRHFRLENERDVLKRFQFRAPSLRPLIDEIEDLSSPPALVLKHLDDDLLHVSAAKKLTLLEAKYVIREVLEALAVLHEDGYVYIDIKPDNILVNHGPGKIRFTDVKLADCGSTVHKDSGHAIDGDIIGAALFRSPEAQLQLRWSTATDIWSLGTTLISLLWGENWHIFKPDVPADREHYGLKILMKHHQYFGPFPLSYKEIADEDSCTILAYAMNGVPRELMKPFALITDKEVTKKDKAFILKLMKLDPRDRPTAKDLLQDEWFRTEHIRLANSLQELQQPAQAALKSVFATTPHGVRRVALPTCCATSSWVTVRIPNGQNNKNRARTLDLETHWLLADQRFESNMCNGNSVSTPNLESCAACPKYLEDIPQCHLLKLPTELRQEIFKHLVPQEPIPSRISWGRVTNNIAARDFLCTDLQAPLIYLLLGFNREIYHEIIDVFYNTATFTIDVANVYWDRRTEPATILRTLISPQLIGSFKTSRGQWSETTGSTYRSAMMRVLNTRMGMNNRDPEVELHDLCDYVAVVVSGVLGKSRQLYDLQVSLYINEANPFPVDAVVDTKLLISPFERLRRVQKPQLMGLFCKQRPIYQTDQCLDGDNQTYDRSIPPHVPNPVPVFFPGILGFKTLSNNWQRRLASKGPSNILPNSPMTNMFVQFKALYNEIAAIMPNAIRNDRQCFLHRARLAREKEDVVAFRAVAAELVGCWRYRLQLQDTERRIVDQALQRVADADIYPPGFKRRDTE